MSLLKKWQKHSKDNGNAIVKHRRNDRGLSRLRDFLQPLDGVFERARQPWLDLDRDPWSALMTLPSRLSDFSGWNWPAIDMAEDENAVTLRVDVPGLDEKDLEVEVSGNLLTIRGAREDEWSDKKHGVRRRERISGSFARTITLPSYVDTQKIEAKYEKGILRINVPKIPGQGPKRVRVTAGS
jgi:HSP20 family protein